MTKYVVYLKDTGYHTSGESVETTQIFDFRSSASMSDFVQALVEHGRGMLRFSVTKVEEKEEEYER